MVTSHTQAEPGLKGPVSHTEDAPLHLIAAGEPNFFKLKMGEPKNV